MAGKPEVCNMIRFQVEVKKRVLIGAALFLLGWPLSAQQAPAQDTARQEVEVDHADVFEYLQAGSDVLQKLNGNVELRQDSIYMYCDTATIRNDMEVYAKGDVLIQQGDSLSVFADSLYYDGSTRIAELFGDVILQKGEQRLFTNRLTYDLSTKVATYQNGATLTQGETQLTSKRGYYYVSDKEIYFKDSVIVIDTAFNLLADTLAFNTESRVVRFLGPTLINSDTTRLYCETGFYDTGRNIAEFRSNAQYQRGEQLAVADTIRYDGQEKAYDLRGNAIFTEGEREATGDVIRYEEELDRTSIRGNGRYRDAEQDIQGDEIIYDAKREVYSTRGRTRISDPPQILEANQVDYSEELGMGLALGDVIWQDTAANLAIRCDTAEYDRQRDYLKAFGGRNGRPLLITLLDGDSLFMASDTLLSLRADSLGQDSLGQDSARQLRAYHDVRIYKSDLQALCDSLVYSTTDSIFRLFREPLVWSDTSQFYADTVNIQLVNDQIDRIYLRQNAFIVNSPDEILFNQVKGKFITAVFRKNELRRMDVNGNAESVYYAIDDSKKYVGVNKTVCSEMVLYFGDNEVEKIKFMNQPKAQMLPMGQANHEQLKLEGVRWDTDFRPGGLDDLFDLSRKRELQPLPVNGRQVKKPERPATAGGKEKTTE